MGSAGRSRGWWIVVGLLALASPRLGAQPGPVVVTVKPVHALAAAVMAGVAEPVLLLDGAASPHGYTLRPSDARHLRAASLLVRVGPTLEPFLERTLRSLPDSVRVLTLAQVEGLELARARAGGAFEAHGTHAHEPGDGGGDIDPHLWLDPRNARRIVQVLAAALAQLDPAHAPEYRRNAAAADGRLAALDAELAVRLAPVRDRPFVVFHDAYQYLERHYGLRAVASLAVTPEHVASAHRVQEIRARIQRSGAACVFREPQFRASLIRALTEDLAVEVAVLDPLGIDLAPGPEAYFQLMRNMAGALARCLAP